MPQKNTLKIYTPHTHYHVYSRGANKQAIFLNITDFEYFTALLKRYLDSEQQSSKTGVVYPNYHNKIQLQAYCLMSNHIHLLIYQLDDEQSLKKFMSSLMTSYGMYFNLKYGRLGSVFESRYKAKIIDNDAYLLHIGRYIHMNPSRWRDYRFSSLKNVFAGTTPGWLNMRLIYDEFSNEADYMEFLNDYQATKDSLSLIKHQLADH
jgi:REP element-mobilizing transposase RayT